MLNQEQIRDKWKEIRGGVRNFWGKISDEDIDQTKGNLFKLSDLVQEKYGESKSSIKKNLNKLLGSFENLEDKGIERPQSSYKRRPAESKYDKNFSVGRDLSDPSEERNFNSSSSSVGGVRQQSQDTSESDKDTSHHEREAHH